MTSQDQPQWEDEPSAYPRLASFMSSAPDQSCMIFRRFDHLNVRNLLIMEAQILNLEKELQSLENECEGVGENADGLRDWSLLQDQAGSAEDTVMKERASDIIEVSRALGELLEKYYSALSRTKEITSMPPPKPKHLKAIRNIIRRSSAGAKSRKKLLQGDMKHHLDLVYEADLSVVSSQRTGGILSGPLKRSLSFLNKDQSPAANHQLFQRTVSLMTAMAATFFLITAVVALYSIANESARLGALCAFCILFAATLAGFTNATRQEVFVATAAYAAVLVVFVSGNFSLANTSNTTNLFGNANVDGTQDSQIVQSPAAVTVRVTETAVTAMATVVETVTQGAVETLVVTSTLVASPTGSLAAERNSGDLAPEVKVGIGMGIAAAAAVGLLVLGAICISMLQAINKAIAGFRERRMRRPSERRRQKTWFEEKRANSQV